VLEGWQLNSIVHLQTGLPWSAIGSQDISQTGELTDHWDFFGNRSDFKPGPQDSLVGIPYFKGGATNMPSACTTAAASIGATASLNQFGCYARKGSRLSSRTQWKPSVVLLRRRVLSVRIGLSLSATLLSFVVVFAGRLADEFVIFSDF
jgi:hypothetical protein